MNCARQSRSRRALFARSSVPNRFVSRSFSVAVMSYSLSKIYGGTREGVILVSMTPPTTDITKLKTPRVRSNGHKNGNGDRRRDELADFLRNRRASLTPDDVGLPNGGRRRTPGLRREEVAQLAGVGATWYTWLEQGRDVRASLEVLEAISSALRLTRAERAHLILLGRGEEAPPCKSPVERASASLRRLIANLGTNPAYIIGRRWDYLAWNDAATALLGDFGALPRSARNHVWQTFMAPRRRALFTDWELTYPLLVAKFRADS